ncbi:transposase [Amycolatopsis halotolerans]|uniref:Transposase n=1 Tax=Amycolatopsis halotolerans TaxID=330083 RepID=A0ABV7QNB8_9PSEU
MPRSRKPPAPRSPTPHATASASPPASSSAASATPPPATRPGNCFPIYRYQAVFTNTGLGTAAAETCHRGRAGTIEQIFADLNDSALAHFPSGRFHANAAWLALAAITHNLLRAAGSLASPFHARARTGTIRAQLIAVAARITRTARTTALRLPRAWPRSASFLSLFTATHRQT